MRESDMTSYFVGFLTDAAYLAGVPLLVATFAALVISVLQAMTQVQDQNLSQTVKIVAIVLVFVIAGTSLVQPLVLRTERTFSQLHMF
ncbi:MAG: flagellar biosynthetic protein FliQ [Rhodobacter sp.]|nr:flagellar biosynthetic protein FliQ [Rhodobacter sp.]